jgi:hypothetical protein
VTAVNDRRAADALRRQAQHIAGPVAATIEQVATSDMNSLDEARRVGLFVSLTTLQAVCRSLLETADRIDPQEDPR